MEDICSLKAVNHPEKERYMKLKELLHYKHIVIQCHDNPDADTMGSAYGVYCYLKKKDPKKDVRILYTGDYRIEKSDLKLMVRELDIPIEYVSALEPPDLLITVDCQYGNGNVTAFEAKQVAVIDHHQISSPRLPGVDGLCGQPEVLSTQFVEIHNTLGSCCTVVYKMLKAAGFDVNHNENLATALYYGLYMDTKRCAEIYSEDDKKLRDHVHYNKKKLHMFQNSNLTLKELEIAGRALLGYRYFKEKRYAIVCAEACDPNLLGLISDFMMEVDVVDVSLVYSILPFGIKLSVRGSTPRTHADKLADYLTGDVDNKHGSVVKYGSGGGHTTKAGGFIDRALFASVHPDIPMEDKPISEFFMKRMETFFNGEE